VQRYVAVVGPSEPHDPGLLDLAERLGHLLGARGDVVVTGGLGGVMAAAARGAHEAAGLTLALLPGDDRADAAPGNTVVVPTGLGEMRNALVVRTADVVVAVGGSWGTLSEVALALRTGVPVVSLRGWDLEGLDDRGAPAGLSKCGTAEEAVARIDEVLA
jgi:uncharacterized protein (TIGR00725 family)